MRFFHLSDLHIGLRLLNRDLQEDQKYILNQIVSLAGEHQPDAVVIAGDIYDKAVPSAEAVELFDGFVTGLTEALPEAEIMMISGNHDSGPRVNVFRSVLERHHVHMIGLPPKAAGERIAQVTVCDDYGKVHFYLLPFVRPGMVRFLTEDAGNGANLSYSEAVSRLIAAEDIDVSERNVLVSHQFYLPSGKDANDVERAESEIVTVGNIDAVDASVLAPFDYAALGHIHKPMAAGSERFRYSGTPLACSLSEAGQEKGVILVTLGEKGDVRTEVLPLRPLRAVRLIEGRLDEVLLAPSDDFVRVTLTDPEDLEVMDMQDRLRLAFPNLLEIRRTGGVYSEAGDLSERPSELSPYELCSQFLTNFTDEEAEILREVINEAGEVKG